MEKLREIRHISTHTINNEIRCQYDEWQIVDGVEVEGSRTLKEVYIQDVESNLVLFNAVSLMKDEFIRIINEQTT